MAQKVILVADPGIDTAFAVALALHDPELDVLGLVASAGNIPADRATQNVHLLINAIDPPKWPRLGAALPVKYEIDGTKLHGPDGLGNVELPPVSLAPADAGRQADRRPGPRAPPRGDDRCPRARHRPGRGVRPRPELPALIERIVFLGGAWRVPGNATAVGRVPLLLRPGRGPAGPPVRRGQSR